MSENKTKIIIESESAQATGDLEKVKQIQEQVGDSAKKTGEAGRLGFFALGNAVEDAARNMGVAGQASRQLGNSVERVAASALPAFGAAIGVGVLAIGSMVAITTQLIERKQKLREELLKASDAAGEWIGAAEKMTKAEYNRYLVEFARNQEDLNKGMAERKKLIAELEDQTSKYITVDLEGTEVIIERQNKVNQELVKELVNQRSILAVEEERAAKKAKTFDELTSDKTGGDKGGDDWISRRIKLQDEMHARTARNYEAEAAYTEAYASLLQTLGDDEEEILNARLAAFDLHTAAKLELMDDEDEKAQWLTTRQIEYDNLKTKTRRAIISAEWDMAINFAGRTAALAKQMYEISNSHDRKYFTAYKIIAEGQAAMNIAVGITKALSSKGWAGIAEGLLIAAEGAVQLASIRKQTPDGAGGISAPGGGGGAVGTFDANAFTGMPEQKGGGNTYITMQDSKGNDLVTYELAEGVLKVIHQQGGTVGRYSVKVETHA